MGSTVVAICTCPKTYAGLKLAGVTCHYIEETEELPTVIASIDTQHAGVLIYPGELQDVIADFFIAHPHVLPVAVAG